MEEFIEFSTPEVREEIKSFYKGVCRIDWCRTCKKPTKEQVEKIACDTLEHIIPKKHGGSNHLKNLTYTVAFCNSLKGHNITDKELLNKLLIEAEKNWLKILKRLLNKRINTHKSNKGFFKVRILSVVYEVKVTRQGNIYVLKEQDVTSYEIIPVKDIKEHVRF